MSFDEFRKECEKQLGENFKKSRLEKPPKEVPADLAFPCFQLSKEFKKSPQEIAEELSSKMKSSGLIKEIKSEGPYVNFYADWKNLSKDIISDILNKKDTYGKGKQKEKIIVEYSSPNTNKPLHVGHLRNDSIGMSISNILEFQGNKITRTEIINDRGVHICKSMLAYQKWGNDKTPDVKSDHFVGDFYVMFEQKLKEDETLKEEIQGMLKKWEDGDKDIRKLWKKMNDWVIDGMEETYRTFGSKFDFVTLESDIYDKASSIIKEGKKKNLFEKNDQNHLIAKLEPELPNKVVLRADGTSVYITMDLFLDKMRYDEYKFDKMIHVVATEQNLHFKQLFKIFEKLDYKWAKNCYHLSYGLVNLPSGRMKTREGTVVDADELISNLQKLAKDEINKREKLNDKELDERSLQIALAAIKYFMLKIEPIKDVLFDPEKAISFEGDTGPYLQYTNARATSILKKSNKKPKPNSLNERLLVKKLSEFPIIVEKSGNELRPSQIANYLFELSAIFNTFYHEEKVIGSKDEESKLALVNAVQIVLSNGLRLLGITPLEKM